MSKKNRNYIDEMVDLFGYDYVIGFCICSDYDLRKRADIEQDENKRASMLKKADRYKYKADQLVNERFNNGL